MKTVNKRAGRRAVTVARVAPMALGALVLAGCAGTHVGDAWQCPIAQGKVCSSVAAADPAVPETLVPEPRTADVLSLRTPLYEARAGSGERAGMRDGAVSAGTADRSCAGGCNPFAWLTSLFTSADTAASSESRGVGAAGRETPEAAPAPQTASGVVEPAAPGTQAERGGPPTPPPASGVPAPRAIAPDAPAGNVVAGDDLRTPETVGRVWIGPFVDAGGVYREGAYVRLVIAPAAWRLP